MYHNQFAFNVNQYGSSLNYTFDEFYEDFRKGSIHGLDFALGPLKSILEENEDVFDMDDFSKQLGNRDADDDQVKMEMEKEIQNRINSTKINSAYLKRIKGIVDDFVTMGMWDMY